MSEVIARKTSEQALGAFVCVVGLVAFANSFFGVFVFDDLPNVVENERLHSFRATWDAHGAEIPIGLRRRVVGRWSFAVNQAISGHDTWSYHAFNLAIHLCAGVLLFEIVRRTIQRYSKDVDLRRDANWLACGIAAIWVVHPIQTESVTYIVQRLESLCGLFYLALLYCTLRGSESAKPGRWYTIALAACVAGMATKEVMVTAPITLLLFDRVFLASSWKDLTQRRGLLHTGTVLAMLVLVWLASSSIFRKAAPSKPSADSAATVLQVTKADLVQGDIPSRREFLQTQPQVVLHYIRLAFWPTGQCLDHRWPVAKTFSEVAPPAVLISAIVFVGLWLTWKKPAVGFLILSFFIVLSPTSTIIPLRVAFEHRMYLPLASLISLVVLGLHRIDRLRPALPWLIAVATVLLICVTYQRNKVYYSQVAMYTDNVMKAPHNPRAYLNLSNALLEEGEFEAAKAVAEVAVELKPKDAVTWTSLGSVLVKQASYEQAIDCLVKAIELDPANATAHHRLAESLDQLGQWSKADQHFREAIQLDPTDFQIRNDFGVGLAANGMLENAETQLREALRLNASSSEAHNNLGTVLMMGQQSLDEAVAHFRQAVTLDPSSEECRQNLERAMAVAQGTRDVQE